MRMTSASEYACLALIGIGRAHPAWSKRNDLCAEFHIPSAFLVQILHKLAAAGLVVSRRGAEGGFRLARSPQEVNIAEVIRAIDGPLAPVSSVSLNFYQPSPLEGSPAFHRLFRRVRDAVAEILESTTLADVLADEQRIASSTHRPRRRGASR